MRSQSLGEQVAGILRLAIVRGEYSPGERLVEEAVAERFAVSRGPVRDALRVLAGEHLIEGAGRGYAVRGVDADDIDELYDVRLGIESVAMRAAAERASTADWTDARAALESMRAAADAGDWARYAQEDLAFHATFYAASGNRRLVTLWEQLAPLFGVILQLTNEQDVDLRPSWQDHERLLQAVLAGDADAATALLSDHLHGSRRRMKLAVAGRGGGA